MRNQPAATTPGEETRRAATRGLDSEGPLRKRRTTWPDRLTLLRFYSLPVLWILAATRFTSWLAVGVAVAASTDVMDGIIARRSHQVTERGSRRDSIADHLLSASVAVWLIWLRPDFVARELWPLAGWASLAMVTLATGWVKHGRVGNLHLYLSKLAGASGYLFAVWVLYFGTYDRLLFHVVLIVCVLGTGEALVVFATRTTVDSHVGSILNPANLRRRDRG